MDSNAILFTPQGRQEVIRLLKLLQPSTEWLVCERGFLDHSEGIGVSDASALDIIMKQHSIHATTELFKGLNEIDAGLTARAG